MRLVKEPCLLVPSRQSSVASGQFGLDFQGAGPFERNLKLINFSPMDTKVCPYVVVALLHLYLKNHMSYKKIEGWRNQSLHPSIFELITMATWAQIPKAGIWIV